MENVDPGLTQDPTQDLGRRQRYMISRRPIVNITDQCRSASNKRLVDDLLNKATDEPPFHSIMQRCVTPELYVEIALHKLHKRVAYAFDALDLKCFWTTVSAQDVRDCAQTLQHIATTVIEFLDHQADEQDTPPALKFGLADILLRIIEGIVKRKGDLSLRLAVPFQPSHMDDPEAMNLFMATVGDFDWAERRVFVLTELADVREELEERYVERIERIALDLEAADAPEEYVRLLRSLVV